MVASSNNVLSLLCATILVLISRSSRVESYPNYADALAKSFTFFSGQRSGKLPANNPISWRGDSALTDGKSAGVDLTGGYYDAGDNVKFNLPMSFTTTMLSWTVLEHGQKLGTQQLKNNLEAIRWATDYLLKCATATPGKLYVGVADPVADHKCWERPEDMDTPRTVYSVSASNPGSDVAGEIAAALAAASLTFRKVDANYSKRLLQTAETVFKFAMDYKGSYTQSLGSAVCPFYCSYNGYKDELLWGAAWLYTATNNPYYLNLVTSMGASDQADSFSWDNKFAGAYVLLSSKSLFNNDQRFQPFKQGAENFVCKILPNSPYSSTKYTKGGLIYKQKETNLQFATAISYLLVTYSKFMAESKHTFNCGSLSVDYLALQNLARRQVDYILGDNPLKLSYMVGYGGNFPKKIHHRGSSIISKKAQFKPASCQDGFRLFFNSPNPNPNILTGAIVGGPDESDNYSDNRQDSGSAEPATYINAALVGPLAYFS